MADNFYKDNKELRAQAADEVSGVLFPRFKLVWGADNTCTDTSAAAPLPTTIATTSTVLVGDVSLGVRATATNAALAAKVLSANTTNGTIVKASAGRVYGLMLTNTGNAPRYFKLHNSTTVTAGTTAVAHVFCIPTGGSVQTQIGPGVSFGTGICYSITSGSADNDTGAIGTGEVTGALFYA